jgi:8-oxo-dGTP pyrophosphatase MutT (NUDIX family)
MTQETQSAGGVVLNPSGMILMVSQHGDSWSLPKGHVEPGETELEAAVREVYEETGVEQLRLIKRLGSYKRYRIGINGNADDTSELKEIIFFQFETEQLDLNPIDEHHPEAIWIDKTQVADLLTHKKDKEFFLSIIDLL